MAKLLRTPAQAGVQLDAPTWIPACAGIRKSGKRTRITASNFTPARSPAEAGA
jgi:hypothetical protein